MSYADLTDADVFAYARRKRAERVARKYGPTIRVKAPNPEAVDVFNVSKTYATLQLDKGTTRASLDQRTRRKRTGPEPTAHAGTPGTRLFSIRVFQRNRCYLCGEKFAHVGDISQEHVKPRAKGGSRNHVLLAHHGCNQAKADREPYACELLYLRAVNLRLSERAVEITR